MNPGFNSQPSPHPHPHPHPDLPPQMASNSGYAPPPMHPGAAAPLQSADYHHQAHQTHHSQHLQQQQQQQQQQQHHHQHYAHQYQPQPQPQPLAHQQHQQHHDQLPPHAHTPSHPHQLSQMLPVPHHHQQQQQQQQQQQHRQHQLHQPSHPHPHHQHQHSGPLLHVQDQGQQPQHQVASHLRQGSLHVPGLKVEDNDHKPPGEASLAPVSNVEDATGRRFRLSVEQQPVRARMCGFGDKDRRPITPPPCIQLIIAGAVTGQELSYDNLEYGMFVVNVDLWSADGKHDVNMVKGSQNSTTISSTQQFSFTSLQGQDHMAPDPYAPPAIKQELYKQEPMYSTGYGQEYPVQSNYASVPAAYTGASYGPAQQYYPHQTPRPDASVIPYHAQGGMGYPGDTTPGGYSQEPSSTTRMSSMGEDRSQGTSSRNLIGSLTVSAFRLADTTDKLGIWFVFQDLSVRTEGQFRLKFQFINVGRQEPGSSSPKVAEQGRVKILAEAFSKPFTVYSAKKFPGVCESTPLSKKFASQGIKIPIRKDGASRGNDEDDD